MEGESINPFLKRVVEEEARLHGVVGETKPMLTRIMSIANNDINKGKLSNVRGGLP
jgi:hypothetical protein